MTDSTPTLTLGDGTTIPAIGLGTYGLVGTHGADSIAGAIGLGYRLIDTAYSYENEDAVGEGIRRSGIDPAELVVTSKVPNGHHGRDRTLAAFDKSMQRLGLDKLGLLLIHWPEPHDGLYVETWQTLVELQQQGRVRSIGVSNFDGEQLDRVIDASGVTPALNQVPVDLARPNRVAREADAARGILTESYSPLKFSDELARHPLVTRIAGAHGVTTNQVILRWHIQSGNLPIPRSRSLEHQRENFDVFGFELSADELGDLDEISGTAGGIGG
ncbi:aldo/keto reductase [Gryllotalpicola reticulitermitis]|uniref:Aldo/keto reductase n=1 Tax=Gryllotalpicola reticulitermitis TaxID=1184153 RepID=A0ABV8Q8V8_9MICO